LAASVKTAAAIPRTYHKIPKYKFWLSLLFEYLISIELAVRGV
jgi:hypothetical protein